MRDEAAFDAFYRATVPRMLLYMYAVCGDRTEAQDLTQEAYARAWQRWSRVGTYDDPEAWVRTVAWRLAASQFRSARRRVTALVRLGRPDPAPPPSADAVAVLAALRRLNREQRGAIVMHYLHHMSVAEIASASGVPAGTVKARLSRGRTALAPLLAETIEEAPDVR
jgi:RNA polymerase sigma-70 factor (ECF subfamily)